MTTVTVRAMTPPEYEQWIEELAHLLADEKVQAGTWSPEGAVDRAREAVLVQLPQGQATPRMLFLRGIDGDGQPIGRAWVSLDHPRDPTPGLAFLHDIAVVPSRRGAGLGRALLAAVEQAAREAGAGALELNVFGHNAVAMGLYVSSGYGIVTQQLRKAL